MRLTAAQLAVLSDLLDQALDLEEHERAAWLEALLEPFDGAVGLLREMLARDAGGPGAGVLDTLPKIDAAATETPASIYEAGLMIGPYRLLRELGRGGMGQVWLAEQLAPVRRRVALKLIRAGMYDETTAQRFQAERQSLASMDHPSIAKVFDAGSTAQGQPYFAMEYVPGLPIHRYCDANKLSLRARIELFIQCCEGVQHAHQKAVIHRDLKPANILILEVDGKPLPRIIDFGIAKPAMRRTTQEPAYTQLGFFLGTPGYMSPEQVDPEQQDIDTRTDVYSLGVILYELLAGVQPFDVKQLPLEEWLRRLRTEDPPRLSLRSSGDRVTAMSIAAARSSDYRDWFRSLRGDLDWIAMKALERDRERRYSSASDLAADLRRHLNHEPILAHPPSKTYQLGKFLRRHRLAGAIAATLALFSFAMAIAGIIAIQQKREAQFQANQAVRAQSRLLTQAATQRLRDGDVPAAQALILEVLADRRAPGPAAPAAVSVFQDVRAADPAVAILAGHRDIVWSAQFSTDGSRLVSASKDGTARVWDVRTGVLLRTLSVAGTRFHCAAYSPDGTHIVGALRDKTARVWDAVTGEGVLVLSGHEGDIQSVAYSPDGKRIVTTSKDKTARIWDALSGTALRILQGHTDVVQDAAFAPDGIHVVTSGFDNTARVWDGVTGRSLRALTGHTAPVYSARFSPDGKRIVTASQDRTVRVWEAATGVQLLVLDRDSTDAMYSAGYSPDGSRIVSGSADHRARIWDARTGAPLADLIGHRDGVESAAFSADGTRIATASSDGTVRIWDGRQGLPLVAMAGHTDVIEYAGFSPDGSRVVSASRDRSARVWDVRSGAPVLRLAGHRDVVESATYSPDGTQILTTSQDRTARLWDARSGELVRVFPAPDTATNVDAAMDGGAFSPDGRRIVVAAQDKAAHIWDAATGAPVAALVGHEGMVYSAAYSPDGNSIVTASADQTARLWDARTGAALRILSGHKGSVPTAAFSPDGQRVVTASADGTARIWMARTGMLLAELAGHSGIVQSAAFSPDGAQVVTASSDRTARIWESATGVQLAALPHPDVVSLAAFAPAGTRIVTGSLDKIVRVWEVPPPGKLHDQISWARAAQFDPPPATARTELGLPPELDTRTWTAEATDCDRIAASIDDPDRVTAGVLDSSIVAAVAERECSAVRSASIPRLIYELGRALAAKQDLPAARTDFELAADQGYRAANVDLARLLANGPAGVFDAGRALAAYERAWRRGVAVAAAELGHLYEHGLPVPDNPSAFALAPDAAAAWRWYAQGRARGEPHAIARFAERAETRALAERDPTQQDALLVEAFAGYTAATECARLDGWPDEAWRAWRYRRATLARTLARDGLMKPVAQQFDAVSERPPCESRAAWPGVKADVVR